MTTATDGISVLRDADSILLIDWPLRDVPDSLVRSGKTVVSQDGPLKYNRYVLEDDAVEILPTDGPPDHADLVYAFRPLDELPEIVALAVEVGARAVWLQSGLDENGERDLRGTWRAAEDADIARHAIEGAGLIYVDGTFIADAVAADSS